MGKMDKIKVWLKEQVPMLTVLYENKYIGMAYDRFASLPAPTQRKLLGGTIGVAFGAASLFLFFNYIQLWKISSQNKEASALSAVIQQYQKTIRDKAQQLQDVELGSNFQGPGQLKQKLSDLGRFSGISPKLIKVEEKAQGTNNFKMVNVTMEKVNLSQIVNYIKSIESDKGTLTISSLRIRSDEKLRGYMVVDLEVKAQLIQREGS